MGTNYIGLAKAEIRDLEMEFFGALMHRSDKESPEELEQRLFKLMGDKTLITNIWNNRMDLCRFFRIDEKLYLHRIIDRITTLKNIIAELGLLSQKVGKKS